MLSAQVKADIRRHMGVPVSGINAGGVQLGYRYDTRVGTLEYRMNNLQPVEEAIITGQPLGSVRIAGASVVGDTLGVTITPAGGSAFPAINYTVTNADIAAMQNTPGFFNNGPLYSIAQNFSNAVTRANAGVYGAPNPPVDIASAPGYGPGFAELLISSLTSTAFTMTVTSTGGTVLAVLAQGNPVWPQATFDDAPTIQNANGVVNVAGYIPILNYLDANISTQTNSNLSFSKADVVDFRPDELPSRQALYNRAVQRLADFFGIPPYPMGQPGRGRGSIA